MWDFQCKERTRPLQQYSRAYPKTRAFAGRVHALHAVAAPEATVAVVRAAWLMTQRSAAHATATHCAACAQFAAGDGAVSVFEPATGQVLFSLQRPHAAQPVRAAPAGAPAASATVTAACLSPSGRLLATAGVDNAVKVWDASDGALLCNLVGHSAPPHSLVWAPDDRVLVSGGGADTAPRAWAAPAPADA